MRMLLVFSTALLLLAAIPPPSAHAQPRDTCDAAASRALVLSGGGFKGAFEVGAAYHLVIHRRCDFHDFAGVSAGSLNAAFLAQAPSHTASLESLQSRARQLVAFWRTIRGPEDILRERFLGFLGVLLFGHESKVYFSPLWDKIRANVSVEDIKKSGRHIRVGVVSFWDGKYREVTPTSPLVRTDEQFLQYVFASALVPVYGYMPRIRESPNQPDDDRRWAQFADGGVRHITPIANYFVSGEGIKWAKQVADEIPDHPNVSEIFLILASPYNPPSDQVDPPRCCPESSGNRRIKNGREIIDRALELALDAPYRWDVNFARVANSMLAWRDIIYRRAEQQLTIQDFVSFLAETRGSFPVESFNRPPGSRWSLPYKLAVISPPRRLGATFEVSPDNIALQLHHGCLAANNAFVKEFGGAPLDAMCMQEFPPPPTEAGRKRPG